MITKICEQCGKEFKVKPCHKDTAKFHSRECYYKSMEGNIPWNKGKKGVMPEPWNKGKKTGLVPKSVFKKGQSPWNKGLKCPQSAGKNHYNWKGGRVKHTEGYILILQPEHPSADSRGYVFEHRLVAEKCLNRYLASKEIIHHINEIKNDNHSKNLYLFSSNSAHRIFHGSKVKPILISNLPSIS